MKHLKKFNENANLNKLELVKNYLSTIDGRISGPHDIPDAPVCEKGYYAYVWMHSIDEFYEFLESIDVEFEEDSDREPVDENNFAILFYI